jgi:hypothetical protein
VTAPIIDPASAAVKAQQQHRFITDAQLCVRWNVTKQSLWRLRKRDPAAHAPSMGSRGGRTSAICPRSKRTSRSCSLSVLPT